MSAMVIEAPDLQAQHDERLRTDPAYLQAYLDQVDEWSRGLSDSALLYLVQEYRKRRRAEPQLPVELVDAAREYVRRHPRKLDQFPELSGSSGALRGRPSRRRSHPHMIDDSIQV